MCGVFGLVHGMSAREFSDRFGLSNLPKKLEDFELYKITPRSTVATVSRNSPNRLVPRIWWLAPPWADDPYRFKFPTFNARSETIADKPAFRHAWKHGQRCLIPASYFVEWHTVPDPDKPDVKSRALKLPYRVQLKGGGLFSFAGLYEVWKRDAEGKEVESCTIITTKPNKLLATIHNRQPVILRKQDEQTWLDPDTDLEKALKLLKPLPASEIEMFRIDVAFNKTWGGDVTDELVSPVDETNGMPAQQKLTLVG